MAFAVWLPEISNWLSVLANIAAILTAFVAVVAYGKYEYNRHMQLKRLEALLKPKDGGELGGLPLMNAAAELGMTEAQTMDASFRSKKITRLVSSPMPGQPSRIVLRYRENKRRQS